MTLSTVPGQFGRDELASSSWLPHLSERRTQRSGTTKSRGPTRFGNTQYSVCRTRGAHRSTGATCHLCRSQHYCPTTGSSTSMAVADQNTASPRNSWTQAIQQHSHANATPSCDRQRCSPPTALPHAPIVTEGRLYGGQVLGHADTEAVASAQPQLAAQSTLHTQFEEEATTALSRFANRVSKNFADMHKSWAGGRVPGGYNYR